MPGAVIERLCGHHDATAFESGPGRLHPNLRIAEAPREALVYVAAENFIVQGYIAIEEFDIRTPTNESRKYVLVPAFAVTQSKRHSAIASQLVSRLMRWMEERDPSRKRYHGMLCAQADNTDVARFLSRLDFTNDWPLGPYWYRQF